MFYLSRNSDWEEDEIYLFTFSLLLIFTMKKSILMSIFRDFCRHRNLFRGTIWIDTIGPYPLSSEIILYRIKSGKTFDFLNRELGSISQGGVMGWNYQSCRFLSRIIVSY